ncbi:jg7524 [Pararge aegeria aegeria]|uniref:Jg7524 protein n=1 Tax=Pararge aegeria aegeria TaxID=348720 RepID=A0A8S4RHF6_9NEOP|nr:jg7524 [Pararge aegeria aegeria]
MGRALVWDATCVDTLAASHLPSTSQKAAAAAESAQMLKRRKYSVICNDYVFAALAFETLGPLVFGHEKFY